MGEREGRRMEMEEWVRVGGGEMGLQKRGLERRVGMEEKEGRWMRMGEKEGRRMEMEEKAGRWIGMKEK